MLVLPAIEQSQAVLQKENQRICYHYLQEHPRVFVLFINRIQLSYPLLAPRYKVWGYEVPTSSQIMKICSD
jgi:hypothetical protein